MRLTRGLKGAVLCNWLKWIRRTNDYGRGASVPAEITGFPCFSTLFFSPFVYHN
jgi:hypothetical protein